MTRIAPPRPDGIRRTLPPEAALRRALLLGGGAAALSACAPLGALETATVAPSLYRLSPKSTFEEGLPKLRKVQIVIEEPYAGASINTDRIAVRPHPLQVEYFPDARWVDRAPVMVQALLMESLENADGELPVGRQAAGLAGDYILLAELREFQAEASGAADPAAPGGAGAVEVHVRLNLKLMVEPEREIVGSATFARRIAAPSSELLPVVETFDLALGKCLRRAVGWTLKTIAAHEESRPPRIPGW